MMKQIVSCQQGQSLLEYILLISFIAMVAAASLGILGLIVKELYKIS